MGPILLKESQIERSAQASRCWNKFAEKDLSLDISHGAMPNTPPSDQSPLQVLVLLSSF